MSAHIRPLAERPRRYKKPKNRGKGERRTGAPGAGIVLTPAAPAEGVPSTIKYYAIAITLDD
jgi:hypothetical protein